MDANLHKVKRAGFWRRLCAFLIDVIPITLIIAAVFYFFFGFDATFSKYRNRQPNDLDVQIEYISQRNLIRKISLVTYLCYCALLESTALKGSLGKKLVGIEVTDPHGERLSFRKALLRNFSKIASFAPCGLGVFWLLWSPKREAWHDTVTSTAVGVSR